MVRNRLRGLINLQALIHASYDLNPPPRGDKPASYNARELGYTRPMIRNKLLRVLKLPVMIHAQLGFTPSNVPPWVFGVSRGSSFLKLFSPKSWWPFFRFLPFPRHQSTKKSRFFGNYERPASQPKKRLRAQNQLPLAARRTSCKQPFFSAVKGFRFQLKHAKQHGMVLASASAGRWLNVGLALALV